MKKKLLLFSMLFINIIYAQEANNWYFGFGAGLNFSTEPPTVLFDGQINQTEGCSTISDNQGNLLFYSDGITVWNKEHLVMPNGTGLMGSPTSAQSSIIVPFPGQNCSKYFIVTVDHRFGTNGVRYSLVDMSLNAGMGDVVVSEKNIHLFGTTTTESICVAKHSNGSDFWVIGKPVNSVEFYAYHVSSFGFNMVPVISNTSFVPNANLGSVKMSPNNQLLAACHNENSSSGGGVYVFNFDEETGQITEIFKDTSSEIRVYSYSVEFSPDNSLLYFTRVAFDTSIYQYNLNVANNNDFVNSRQIVGNTSNAGANNEIIGTLQRASNGKIYVALMNSSSLGIINNPNIIGAGCNYQDQAQDLGGRISRHGLPSFPTFLVNPPIVFSPAEYCSDEIFTFPSTPVDGTWTDENNQIVNTPSNLLSQTYTFTPNIECSLSSNWIVTVNPNITPTFTQVPSICSGVPLSDLPTLSNNGITGTWSPALNNTTTTTYTFTPDTGQCASTISMTIEVTACFDSYNCNESYNPNLCYLDQPFGTVDFSIEQKIVSEDEIAIYQSPLLADINGDCIPEIIMQDTNNIDGASASGIKIINSLNGETINTIPTYNYRWLAGNSLAVADIYSDGSPEFIVAVADIPINPIQYRGKLVCYNLDGSIQWVSDYQFGENADYKLGGTVGLADFNQDGNPEVYIYNDIFNAKTGVKLCSGGSNGIGKQLEGDQFGTVSISIAAQLDDNNNDLELAAGYSVYKVSINNINGQTGNFMTPYNISIDGELKDGYTSVGDINQDGKLDVIVSSKANTSQTGLYVYTISGDTPILVARANLPSGAGTPAGSVGPAFIGDIDGSGSPTIGVTRPSLLLTYKYNGTTDLELFWQISTSDGSGQTGLTMFDFNQDGIQEIVYRDETQLRIINGATSTPDVLASFECFSGTGLEHPVIGDIDNSGESKILVTCGTNSFDRIGKLLVLGAPELEQAWAPSRGVWNQYAYHVLNINDDLTVPQQQNNNATYANGSYNNFYVQASKLDNNGNFVIPVPDLSGSVNCLEINSEGGYDLSLTITNDEFASLPSSNQGTVISLYNITEDGEFIFINDYLINSILYPGQSISDFSINFSAQQLNELLIVINGNISFDEAVFNYDECNFTNNLITYIPITPTSTQVADICSGDTLAALPTTSNNGITGTWSPALNNTTTTTYTFTPDAGQCATTASMTITVNPNIMPTFTQVADICSGATLMDLPTTSNNGITGTWSPALNNTTTTTYTFTPDAGQCATTASMTITVNPNIMPTFTQVADICSGATLMDLPTTSNNGITGTWSPALNNTTTTTYTFTPDAGQCATTASMTITVNPNIMPTFTQVADICSGATLMDLPTTSNNGITGTWSPALNNTTTTTYTFTPDAGQCATTASMTITVNPNIMPTFTQVADICSGATLMDLPTTSNNGITGTWSPALNNTTTTTYTFTPDAGQCATTASMTITVLQLPSEPSGPSQQLFCAIDSPIVSDIAMSSLNVIWYNMPFGGEALDLITPLTNGMVLYASAYDTLTLCESETRFTVQIQVEDLSPPNIQPGISYCLGSGSMISSLPSVSSTINWYDSPFGGNLLPSDHLLMDGEILYGASLNPSTGCESTTRTPLEIEIVDSRLTYYNLLTIDGNGLNESLKIQGIERFHRNKMEIFNRYGNLVWSTMNYDNISNVFKGAANVQGIVSKGSYLPSGTYFFVLSYPNDCEYTQLTGFIHLDNKL